MQKNWKRDAMKFVSEAITLSGLGAIVWGVAMISGPVAWVVGGILAVIVGCVVYLDAEKR